MASDIVFGILVGGRGTRMGGVQKALLPAPDGPAGDTLLARSVRLGRGLGLEVVLSGQADLGAAAAGVPQIPDTTPPWGPLSGLAALFAYARGRRVIALACDMPFVSAALLERLLTEAPDAVLLAPRDPQTGKWQPLFARYDSAALAPVLERALAAGERSFQALFARVAVAEIALSAEEHALLRDWDTPADVAV